MLCMTPQPLAQRIRNNSQPQPDGCVTWTARHDRDGYGVLWVRQDGRRVMRFAHRIAYELAFGRVPSGLVIDHLCRVRDCVNPEHLEAKTSRANTHAPGSEAPAARNFAKETCPKGHPLVFRVFKSGPRRVCRTCQTEASRKYRARRRDGV